jgi:hypothetical protein
LTCLMSYNPHMDKDNSSYRLVGVVEHIGNSLDSRQYASYVRVVGEGAASSTHLSSADLDDRLNLTWPRFGREI